MQEARRAHDPSPGASGSTRKSCLLAVGDRRDDVDARLALARDEPLLAVQHPVVAVADGGRRQSRRGPSPRPARSAPRPRGTRRGRWARRSAATCSGVASSSSSRGPRSTTANPSPFVALPASSSIATCAEHREAGAAVLGRHVEHREARPRAPCARSSSTSAVVDRAALGDPLPRADTTSCSTKRADAAPSARGSRAAARGRSRARDAYATDLRRGRERTLEHGLLERPRREAVAGLARPRAGSASPAPVDLAGHAAEREDDVRPPRTVR